jgi:hypothetical protein
MRRETLIVSRPGSATLLMKYSSSPDRDQRGLVPPASETFTLDPEGSLNGLLLAPRLSFQVAAVRPFKRLNVLEATLRIADRVELLACRAPMCGAPCLCHRILSG